MSSNCQAIVLIYLFSCAD